MPKFLLALPLLLGLHTAFAASFDCRKAVSTMERLVCSDENLSRQDEELASAYQQARSNSGAAATITRWQRDWLRSETVTACRDAASLGKVYGERITLLREVAPASDAAARWHGFNRRQFKGKTDPDSAELLLIGLAGNRVLISGSAIWRGPNAASGQVNTGEIDTTGQFDQNRLVFVDDGCQGEIQLTKQGLKVEHESGCGGHNVTFNGDYRRQ